MRKLLVVLGFLVSMSTYSQVVVEGWEVIACGSEYVYIKRGEAFVFEHLEINGCNFMLLQDNAVVTLNAFTGDNLAKFIRADAGGGIEYPELGIDRRPGDVNPQIILVGPKLNDEPFPFIVGPNIDLIDNRI